MLFTDPYTAGFSHSGRTTTSETYKHTLKFPPPNQQQFLDNDAIELPNIHQYVPPRTDIDAADALTALYRTHCTSLIDSIRFCKEKQFFRLFTSFHGTLTVPVQKLLAHPNIAPWIKECDWLMYQKMIRCVSHVALQAAPVTVLKFLDTISKNLHAHISRVFQGHPLHVLEAKLEPATLFAGLLHRMLRVNSAAHAAVALLMVDGHRDQMWSDWVAFVNPKRIMESELPNCGYEEVYKILTQDIRTLLLPLNTPIWLENQSHYQEAAMTYGGGSSSGQMTNETVIDRIANFLANLPARFPQASTRTLLHCINALGTAALREITVEQGMSYNPWWITKVFVDEMSLWLASLGGFLDHKAPERPEQSFQMPSTEDSFEHGLQNGNNGGDNAQNSRYSSLGADFTTNTSFMGNNGNASQPGVPQHNESKTTALTSASTLDMLTDPSASVNHHSFTDALSQANYQTSYAQQLPLHTGHEESEHHDDSGIGMSLMDDGFDMSKYGLNEQHVPHVHGLPEQSHLQAHFAGGALSVG